MASILAADTGKAWLRAYHASSFLLAGLVPAALVTDGNKAVDYALGVIMPLHSHVALNFVVSDYVPPAARGAVRAGVAGATIATLAGLYKLNQGPGITKTVKKLWA